MQLERVCWREWKWQQWEIIDYQRGSLRGIRVRGESEGLPWGLLVQRRTRFFDTHPRKARARARQASLEHPPEVCLCRCWIRPSLGHPDCTKITKFPAGHSTTRHHCSAILPITGVSRRRLVALRAHGRCQRTGDSDLRTSVDCGRKKNPTQPQKVLGWISWKYRGK